MPFSRHNPRVLVVDDDPSVRLLLRRFFADLGFHPVEAENPFSALGRISEGSFELAVTDINMPGRSGVWLMEELRALAPDMPVIVMTGSELQANGLRALIGQEARVLHKPFELAALERTLRDVVPHLIGDREAAITFRGERPTVTAGKPYSYASSLIGDMLARTVGLDTLGVPWRGRVHPDDQKRIDDEARNALHAGRRFRAEYRLVSMDGDCVWVLHEAPITADAAGQPSLGPGAIIDITSRKREEELLRASEERHRFLTEHSTDMITVQSPESQFIYVSPASEALLGYEPDELVGRPAYDLIHREDVGHVREMFEEVIRRPFLATVDYRIRRKDRRYVWFETTSHVVAHSDSSLQSEIISVSRDVTERKQNEQRLRELAVLDDLTGLYNRRGFVTLANQQLKAARRSKRNALVLFADLNNLKYINDTLGHKDGDQALIDAAHIFNRTFRESDVVARVGGDEFAILAIETDGEHLDIIRSRIESALELANSDRARAFELSMSIGAATYDPSRNDTVEELLAWADKSMYEHKRARGLNRTSQLTQMN